MTRYFTHTVDGLPAILLLTDSHAAFQPAIDGTVYLLHNKPWRVVENVRIDDDLVVRVVPIDPTPSPACPLRR